MPFARSSPPRHLLGVTEQCRVGNRDAVVPGGPQGLSSTARSGKAALSPLLWFCPISLPQPRGRLPHGHLPHQARGKAEPWFCTGGFGADQRSGWGEGLGWQPLCLPKMRSPEQSHGLTSQRGGLSSRPHLHLPTSSQKTINSAPFSTQRRGAPAGECHTALGRRNPKNL